MKKPTTIEEWNALAAQIRAKQPAQIKVAPKSKLSKRSVSVKINKSLPIHIVQRPKKGKFKIKSYFMTLLWKKRGYRVFEDFTCQCCGKLFSEGWRYIAEDSRVYLCNNCKNSIKPQYIRILYTPM